MKKVLLSLSMLAAVMSANAQAVATGANDDFSTQGNATDNPTGEYSKQLTVGATTYTAGIFWYVDKDYATTYTKTRANGEMAIAVNKDVEYSVVGAGFGDTNGDGTGTPFTLNISNDKTASVKVKASVAVDINFQVEDINGVKLEISGQNKDNGEKMKYTASATTAYQTFTFNLADARLIDHSVGNNPPANDNGYPCANWPTDCPQTLAVNNFDYTQVTKINFLISGGTAYAGTVTFDSFKIGTSSQLGLGTKSAAGNIASTKVYPNPATSEFTAEVSLNSAASTTVILSDMMGKQISTQSVDANGQVSFKTAGLANGIYTVTYVVDGTPAKSELVVVK